MPPKNTPKPILDTESADPLVDQEDQEEENAPAPHNSYAELIETFMRQNGRTGFNEDLEMIEKDDFIHTGLKLLRDGIQYQPFKNGNRFNPNARKLLNYMLWWDEFSVERTPAQLNKFTARLSSMWEHRHDHNWVGLHEAYAVGILQALEQHGDWSEGSTIELAHLLIAVADHPKVG